MSKRITAVDLFCGAGGTSTGLVEACRKVGMKVDLTAVNHWDIAIATHSANHPSSRHMCKRLDKVLPEELAPSGRIDLMVASPECTHHSNARGGKPMNDQSRASAWDILNFLEKIYVKDLLIENVKEFQNWGPLGANGRPLKSKQGDTFRAFIGMLKALGYRVDWKVLNAADFGSATTRHRLFIIARKGNRKINWPEATHEQRNEDTLFGQKQAWRSAREIIDWSIPGKSIFSRKKPLAPATLRRIEAGLRKFGGLAAEPFILVLRKNADARSADDPLPTITTSGSHFGLCTPFILGQQSGATARSVDEPTPTVATSGAISLVQPFIVNIDHAGSGDVPGRSVGEPLATITTKARACLVQPFIVPQFGDSNPKSVDDPLGAITTTSRGIGLCEPMLITVDRPKTNRSRARSMDEPVPVVTGSPRVGLIEPCIIPFYGNSNPQSVEDPLPTITTKDRFGLVTTAEGEYRFDIHFRMLQPHELAAAMGFPKDYEFTGNRESVVQQIGNAVPVELSEALCGALLAA